MLRESLRLDVLALASPGEEPTAPRHWEKVVRRAGFSGARRYEELAEEVERDFAP